jgi:putative ABC transport system permease protein
MTQRLLLYVQYSIRHLWREKRRTAFALFCVTAGVASIVGLQMLGLMITDALTGDIKGSNRGDVSVGPADDFWFTAEQMTAFERLVDDGLATGWTYRCFRDGLDVSLVRDKGAETYQAASAFLVDPAVYPLYGQVLALDPPNVPLDDLLTAPDDVVVSKNLADRAGIAVGDRLRIKYYLASYADSPTLYTVRGIVPTYSATWSWSIIPVAFGFVYLDFDTAPWKALGLEPTATEVFFTTENEAQATVLAEKAAGIAPRTATRTVSDLRAYNERESTTVNQLVRAAGLLALLIGGIGIANTMQAVAARRQFEIAVLKAIGLKGRHVVWLFFTDACLLGLAGGLAGLVLGLGISRTLHKVAVSFLSAPLAWRIYPQPLVTGIGIGVAVTVIFSSLSALAAAQTRPSVVLRPHNGGLWRLGCWQSLAGVLVLTGMMGLLAGQLLQDSLIGLVGAYGVLVLLAALTGLLWFAVWVIEKLPSLGWILLRLAQRGVGRNRARAASALLALVVGLFSVSLITILANTVVDALGSTYIDSIGGDLVIWPYRETDWEFTLQTLKASPDVTSYTQADNFEAELIAINGDPDAHRKRVAAYEQERGTPLTPKEREDMHKHLSKLTGRDLNSNLPHFNLLPGMGRNLAPEDTGRPVALLVDSPATASLKLQPGDRLTFRLDGGAQITLELVGVTDSLVGDFSVGSFVVPQGVLSPLTEPDVRQFVADVNPKDRDRAVTTLSRSLVDRAIVIEADIITTFYGILMQRFAPLPIAIAVLTLFAAATMIANTAALAVMERRREIGVMKAVGVKNWQILSQLLLEGALIGLVGGGIVVGPITLFLKLILEKNELPADINPWPVLGMLALSIGVALAATLVTAWPASRQRPMDVLRYE